MAFHANYGVGMSLELIPLCTATVSLAETFSVSPTMAIGEVTGARLEGDRIKADMFGNAAADWLRIDPAGFGTLDVKLTVKTDDGAIIYAAYSGRLDFGTMTAYATPLFHTGDERYAWINRIQAVAKGTFTAPGTLVYEMFELR
jgi:hypothetical protein